MGSDSKPRTRPVVLTGQRIKLRPLVKADLRYLRRWLEDAELRGIIAEPTPMSKADSEEFLRKVRDDTARLWFMVVLNENSRVIGEAGLLRMDPPWRTTDVTVVIWEREEWGKGYGSETLLLLLDYAFRHLRFHRAAIGVVGFNERALRFWAKNGFRKEGVQRDGYLYNGTYYDFVMMSILEDEFKELNSRSKLGNDRKEAENAR
jgi:diamine N-acetyltransferase